ncbi:sugar phosphate isomerase/epimerase [Paenibacillus frigoriresistens]|uniref:sugar phosphate isomerase/epimerase n=1 Tax=Paenibacillus alginolyticus TaxID=59839 RepID=UPI001567A26D|nr:sugar phosphate isomerase/epimerase [Paenibacillus frigoriresistens]NRF91944.1 sugar phosphate isomerase/epimerase [Paenibacillus frigoriresistens]
MKVKSIKSLWGMGGSLESQFERIAAANYDGIESPLPNEIEKYFGFPVEEKQFRSLLGRYNLDYIAMVFTDGNHAQSFTEQVKQAETFAPLKINAHSARDCMSFDEQASYFEKTQAVEMTLSVPVSHETHRGRAMFTPWTTSALLREFPDLKITADFSHWVCVCESLLEDQQEHLDLAIRRARHIHARVGFAQGPQVGHPAAPEYTLELNMHMDWWKRIIQVNAEAGTELTFTPEFGPPGYMPALPFTKQPVADLWDMCLWMKGQCDHITK